MLIKVLEPFEARNVVGPAVLGCFNYPVGWNMAAGVPSGEVETAGNTSSHLSLSFGTCFLRPPDITMARSFVS